MTSLKKMVLVLGATGRQGSATARHLLATGWRVRALTRNLNQPAAQTLRQAGAEVIQGDNDDRMSLEAAMLGVYGVFSVQAPSNQEVNQGRNVADAAKAVGINHFIYSSVQSAEDLAQAGGDPNKWELEQYIRALNLPTTILRPAFFMETLNALRSDVPRAIPTNAFAIAIKPDVRMGLIAVDDIGAFATLVFEHPDTYLGKTIELAGDALTPPQIATAASEATGHPIQYLQIPIETLRLQDMKIAHSIDFLNETGYTTDISALRKQHPGLMNFGTWLINGGKEEFLSSE